MAYHDKNMTHRLSAADAVEVWLLHWKGEFQHQIAARFGVNPGRINEVLKARKHPESQKIATSKKGAN